MSMTARGPAHRRLCRGVVIMVLVVIAAAWSPPAASAGGPMSVLITDPATHRNAAAYIDDARYRQLAAAIGLDPAWGAELPRSGRPAPSRFGALFRSDLPITWFAHDTVIWRIDLIFFIRDEVWVATGRAWITEPDQADWHPAADPALLRLVLAEAGLLRGSATAWPSWAPAVTPAVRSDAAAGGPLIAVVGCGVAGLGLGIGGTVLLRNRVRLDRRDVEAGVDLPPTPRRSPPSRVPRAEPQRSLRERRVDGLVASRALGPGASVRSMISVATALDDRLESPRALRMCVSRPESTSVPHRPLPTHVSRPESTPAPHQPLPTHVTDQSRLQRLRCRRRVLRRRR